MSKFKVFIYGGNPLYSLRIPKEYRDFECFSNDGLVCIVPVSDLSFKLVRYTENLSKYSDCRKIASDGNLHLPKVLCAAIGLSRKSLVEVYPVCGGKEIVVRKISC